MLALATVALVLFTCLVAVALAVLLLGGKSRDDASQAKEGASEGPGAAQQLTEERRTSNAPPSMGAAADPGARPQVAAAPRATAAASSTPLSPSVPQPALPRVLAEGRRLQLLRLLALHRLVERHVAQGPVSVGGSPKLHEAIKRRVWGFLDSRPRTLVSGCADGQARLFDTSTGRLLVSVRHDVGARKPVSAVLLAAAGPGATLLTGTWDGRWRSWDAWPERPARPTEFARGERNLGHDNVVTGLALTRCQRLLACACSAGRVLLLRRHCPTVEVEVTSAEEIASLKDVLKVGEHSELYLLADLELGGQVLQRDDELLQEADFEGKQTRRDLDKLSLPAKLRFRFVGCLTRGHPRAWRHLEHEDSILCLVQSAEGSEEFLYSGSRDRTVRKWNFRSGALVHTYAGHMSMVRCVAVNSSWLASGCDDRKVRIWRLETPELVRTIAAHRDFLRAVALCTTFVDRLVSSGDDGLVALWDLATGDQLATYRHEPGVTATSLLLRESLLATGASDNRLRLWDTETATIQRELRHPAAVTAMQWL